jgi:hypothetical protein
VIDADPLAACVREIMAERSSWTGTAADLLRASAGRGSDGSSTDRTGWSNPRALAGRLRRVQAPLRAVGIEIGFSREGRAGTRIIKMNTICKNALQTNSGGRANGSRSGRSPVGPETEREASRQG